MNKIRLTDGRELPVNYCTILQGTLWVHLSEHYRVSEAAAFFADETALETIVFTSEEYEETYQGFTQTIRVSINEFSDETLVVLKRPAVES